MKDAGRRGTKGILWPFRGGFGCLFVPTQRVDNLGAEGLLMSYFIDLSLFRQENNYENFGILLQLQLLQLFFEGYACFYFLSIYLYIN